MSISKQMYQKFLDNISPFCKEYSDFWSELLISYGFENNLNENFNSIYYFSMMCNNVEFRVSCYPMTASGIWLMGKYNNGTMFKKKIMTESGLQKFLKMNKLGIYNK